MQEKLRQHIEKTVMLTYEEYAFVLPHFTIKYAKKKDFLIREGESVKYSFFVVSGLLKLVFDDESGNQHIVSFAMEDWWESDFLAYFTQTKATPIVTMPRRYRCVLPFTGKLPKAMYGSPKNGTLFS